MLKWIVLAAAAALAACQTTAAPPPPYRLIDLSDDFTAFYDRTQGMAPAQRIGAFKAEIVPLFPEFYGRERFEDMDQSAYDARIGRALERFPQFRSAYAAKAGAFDALLAPAYASFAHAFPDVGAIGDVYLLNSLGEMDGGTRTFGDRFYFIFGADVMARVHPYEDEAPFFHHELFHVYHHRSFTGCAAVWCSLWTEGLAVYVAKSLNPAATDAQLLLTVPEPIPAAVDANLQEAVCQVRARLNSESDDDSAALFSFQRLSERLPPRFGYYVGYLAAREAGRTRSLQDLSRLGDDEVRPVLDAALGALADCPA